jgi:hypothetical protein
VIIELQSGGPASKALFALQVFLLTQVRVDNVMRTQRYNVATFQPLFFDLSFGDKNAIRAV